MSNFKNTARLGASGREFALALTKTGGPMMGPEIRWFYVQRSILLRLSVMTIPLLCDGRYVTVIISARSATRTSARDLFCVSCDWTLESGASRKPVPVQPT